jgi:inulin fructotransferase (DFA-I-forming)
MADTVYDVTTWTGATVSPYVDIGAVINQIVADIKSKQTTQTTRPGAVIYIPPGHYDLLTRAVIDIGFLQIKGAGHGFLSEAIRDESSTGSWVETLPGASHIRVRNTDGHREAFLVSRSGPPATVGRLNSVVFQDFCLDGVASTKPYTPGNSKIGISFQSDNDAVRIEGMGFVYLEHAIIVKGADAPNITNNFIAECGSCIELTGASQVAKITNNFLISSWGGYSIFAENAEGPHISGNTVLWACNITLQNVNRASITGNKLLSNFPSMIALLNGSSENLIASNHFRRVHGDGASNRFDDKFGLVHIAGDKNTLTSNQFSFSVPAQNITPAGSDPTIVLVKSGDNNYLAANHITSNVPAKVVLDASTTATKVLFSATTAQLDAFTSSHSMVATP